MEDEFKINDTIVELINSHNFDSEITRDKIIPNFKEKVELETWVYIINKYDNAITTRFDIGIKLPDKKEIYEAFADMGSTLDEAVEKNIGNFISSSFHVLVDAFNDTHTHTEILEWEISNKKYNVFLGNYHIKKENPDVNFTIPDNLFDTLKNIITSCQLNDNYHFVRFFYSPYNTELMIDNVCLEDEYFKIEELDWKDDGISYYSTRLFMILKQKK